MVRIFDKDDMRWVTLPGVKLSEYRWYPTQVRQPAQVGSRRRGQQGQEQQGPAGALLLLPASCFWHTWL